MHAHAPNGREHAGIVQLARAGLAHALAPESMARALGVPEEAIVRLPAPGLSRPVSLVGRRATLARPLAAAFARELERAVLALREWAA